VTDKIVELEGQGNVNKERLNQLLLSKRMGDSLRLRIQRGDETKEISICLGSKMEKSFRITPMEHPDPLQKEIFTVGSTESPGRQSSVMITGGRSDLPETRGVYTEGSYPA
jgi:hypothetical protein